MHADGAEVSWDEQNKQWLVRIKVGEEVIRRHFKQPRDTDPATLRQQAVNDAAEEGYEVSAADVVIV